MATVMTAREKEGELAVNYQKSVKIMPRIAYSDPFLLEIIWKDGIFVKAFLHLDDLPRNKLSFAMSKYPNSKNKIEEVAKNRVQSEQRLKSALAPGQNVGAWHIRPFARPSLRPIDSAAVASTVATRRRRRRRGRNR